jgi:hypothetical protein
MVKKLNQILSALDELPDLSALGKLKIFHFIILKILKSNSCVPVKDVVAHPQLSSISQAQRYRYIDDLLSQNLIKYEIKGVLKLA